MPISERTARVVLLSISLLFVLWGLCYVYRTSVIVGGSRLFLLWDDGMISMRYARNLATGHGLTWNPDGERVQGITNLGLTLVMALIHLLPVGVRHVSLVFQLLCLALATACLPMVFDLAFLLFRERAVSVAATAMTALYAPFAILSLQGTDVPAVALPVLASVLVAARAMRERRPWPIASFALMALAIFVRPDASVVYLVLLAFCAGHAGRRSAAMRTGLLVFAALWVGLLAFGWLYYGDLLPNTYYLKATGSPRTLILLSGLRQTWHFVSLTSPLLVVVVGAAILPHVRRDAALALSVAVCAATFAYNVWVGGDWVEPLPSRFIAPALPLAIVLTAGAWWRLAALLADRCRRCRTTLYAAGVAALIVQVNPPGALAEWLSFPRETLLKTANVNQVRLGLYLRDHTDPQTTVAFHWAGTAAYLGDRPGIDVLGKSDRHIAKMTVDRFIPAHSKWDWDYVLGERKPDVFLEQTRGLLRRPDFNRDYRAALTGQEDWIFVRRGSESRLHDPRIAYVEISALHENPQGP
jgi:arabinofuranosyltransferase